MTAQELMVRSAEFAQQLEDIIVRKRSFAMRQAGAGGDRDTLLIAYWVLVMDYDKSILALIQHKFYGGAFALLRPLVEAQVRAHVVLFESDAVVSKIKDDTYTVNFKMVGGQIDTAFNLQGYFDRFLNGARGALHSFTHSGLSQLGRRFKGNDVEANYPDEEIAEVIRTASSAVFLVTNLVTKHFKLVAEAEKVDELFQAWGEQRQMTDGTLRFPNGDRKYPSHVELENRGLVPGDPPAKNCDACGLHCEWWGTPDRMNWKLYNWHSTQLHSEICSRKRT